MFVQISKDYQGKPNAGHWSPCGISMPFVTHHSTVDVEGDCVHAWQSLTHTWGMKRGQVRRGPSVCDMPGEETVLDNVNALRKLPEFGLFKPSVHDASK
eukprot:scaffold80868_cov14-Tisochrysis_lutea.AAC.1